MAKAYKLGVTGGIGSGKSTVAGMLSALGAAVIDADAISRQSTAANGCAIPAIAQVFGSAYIDTQGGLDRARMRDLVFTDPHAKRQLEAIVHPLVAQKTLALLATITARCIVLDHPLLMETDRWRSQLDAVLVVDCTPETQKARVMQRSGLREQAVSQIMANQATRQLRLAGADMVIFNDALSLDALRLEVLELAPRFGL